VDAFDAIQEMLKKSMSKRQHAANADAAEKEVA
jgi:hypothetical protein